MAKSSLNSFAEALLQPDRSVPVGVINPDGTNATKRFDVYRNNVIVSLIDALSSRYPVVAMLVGEKFFQAMAREFVIESPPQSPVMLNYGRDFPAFLANFPPASSLPYLSDIGRLENARRCAYHAPDATPINPKDLECVPPEHFQRLQFKTHPSLVLIQSEFAIQSIWQSNSQGLELTVPIDTPEAVMVCRPNLEVEVRSLPSGAFAFLMAVQDGCTLGDAAQAGLLSSPDFNLATTLTGVLTAQIVTSFQLN